MLSGEDSALDLAKKKNKKNKRLSIVHIVVKVKLDQVRVTTRIRVLYELSQSIRPSKSSDPCSCVAMSLGVPL